MKQVWFGNGIHHHYSNDKFVPEFSEEFFDTRVAGLCDHCLGLKPGEKREDVIALLKKVIFDPAFLAKKVNQSWGLREASVPRPSI